MPAPIAAIEVYSVVFSPEGLVEITFAEGRDQLPDIQVMKILRLDPKRSGRIIEELLSDMHDLIDAALVRMRDDPDELPGR